MKVLLNNTQLCVSQLSLGTVNFGTVMDSKHQNTSLISFELEAIL